MAKTQDLSSISNTQNSAQQLSNDAATNVLNKILETVSSSQTLLKKIDTKITSSQLYESLPQNSNANKLQSHLSPNPSEIASPNLIEQKMGGTEDPSFLITQNITINGEQTMFLSPNKYLKSDDPSQDNLQFSKYRSSARKSKDKRKTVNLSRNQSKESLLLSLKQSQEETTRKLSDLKILPESPWQRSGQSLRQDLSELETPKKDKSPRPLSSNLLRQNQMEIRLVRDQSSRSPSRSSKTQLEFSRQDTVKASRKSSKVESDEHVSTQYTFPVETGPLEAV